MGTTHPALTRTQLHTLIAIGRGEVSKPGPGIFLDLGTARLPGPNGGPNGRAVTTSVNALISKGYARWSTQVVNDRRLAEATAAGHEAISRAEHRRHA